MTIKLNAAFWGLICLSAVSLSSCKSSEPKKDVTTSGLHDSVMQSNIYEVNVRQYTPEGTFKAFSKALPRLKEMGVDILWFMPITPISVQDRKGVLGSYYAVADYTAVNPEFGTMEDWKSLVKEAQGMGMKVIIDWVANHSGADNRWIQSNPDFFIKGADGKLKFAFDWSDTRDFNYWNPVLHDSMINSMKFWVKETGIDGFRCDVAAEVPRSFWQKATAELKKEKPDIFLLAEADIAWIHDAGFHISYGWDAFAQMKKVAKGEASARVLDTVLRKMDETYPPNALKMYFTSNHDENTWNKADYQTMPGAIHAPFAVLTQTWKNSIPLIYSGQEEPFLDSLSFFYKDTILFNKYDRADFYKSLLHLRKKNPALAADAAYSKLATDKDDAVYCYMKEKNGKKVVVLLNLSSQPQTFKVSGAIVGKALNLFSNKTEELKDNQIFTLPEWGYVVYSFE
jgi:glycosidase